MVLWCCCWSVVLLCICFCTCWLNCWLTCLIAECWAIIENANLYIVRGAKFILSAVPCGVVGSLVGYGRELSAVGCVCEISELFRDMDCKGFYWCSFSVVGDFSCFQLFSRICDKKRQLFCRRLWTMRSKVRLTACFNFCCNMMEIYWHGLLLLCLAVVGRAVGGWISEKLSAWIKLTTSRPTI